MKKGIEWSMLYLLIAGIILISVAVFLVLYGKSLIKTGPRTGIDLLKKLFRII